MNSAAVHTGLGSVPSASRTQQLRLAAEVLLGQDAPRPAPMTIGCDVSRSLWECIATTEIPEIYPWVVRMQVAAPTAKPYTTLFSDLPQVRGVKKVLAGFRNKKRAALNLGVYVLIQMLLANLQQWGPPPGKLVTTHPHVTRGPSTRGSIPRLSAGLVSE